MLINFFIVTLLQNMKPDPLVLLFESNPEPEAIAIGYKVPGEMVHGVKLKAAQCRIQIVRLFEAAKKYKDNFDEPLSVGSFTIWDKSKINPNLGHTIDMITQRTPAFLNYIKDRQSQLRQYNKKKASMPQNEIDVGSIVAVKIPRLDRSNLCPTNMAGNVVARKGQFLTVQSRSGIINEKICADRTNMWNGPKPDYLVNPPQQPTTLIGAFRGETSYGKKSVTGNVCHCATGCLSQRCSCRKAGEPCSTKCHDALSCKNVNK